MEILPIRTAVLRAGEDVAAALTKTLTFMDGDIVVVSSKLIAVTEGATHVLDAIPVSPEAVSLSKSCHQDAHFTALVLSEAKRMHGQVAGVSPHVLLTSLKPSGMHEGRILCPNAGLDQSNTESGTAVGWPIDPVQSAQKLWSALRKITGKNIAVIIGDSCCVPGRLGVTAFALVCAGIEPIRSEVGTADLFGKKMRLTYEAVADQLATAANAVMGNGAQSVPAAIIRGFAYEPTDFCGFVQGIDPTEDLFRTVLQD